MTMHFYVVLRIEKPGITWEKLEEKRSSSEKEWDERAHKA